MATKTLTLAEFLLARYDDEAEAWGSGTGLVTQPQFAKLARGVLADLAAKRAIVERAYELMPHAVVEDCWYTCPSATEDRDGGECCDDARRGTGCDCGSDMRIDLLLGLLAAPYASHPDFRPEWAK